MNYKFAPWLGVRAGKVKTALGLYNDTQDMDFLHTWALLPQGIYPTDLRSHYIAHTGGDMYGAIPTEESPASWIYTAYGGIVPSTTAEATTTTRKMPGSISRRSGHTERRRYQVDTPVKGLMLGTSWVNKTMHRDRRMNPAVALGGPIHHRRLFRDSRADWWRILGNLQQGQLGI